MSAGSQVISLDYKGNIIRHPLHHENCRCAQCVARHTDDCKCENCVVYTPPCYCKKIPCICDDPKNFRPMSPLSTRQSTPLSTPQSSPRFKKVKKSSKSYKKVKKSKKAKKSKRKNKKTPLRRR